MKQIYLLLLVLTGCHLGGFTQKFYIQGSGGYAFGFLKENISAVSSTAKIQYDSIYDESFQYESHPFSFGTGGSFNLGIGMMVTEYLNIELSGFYNPCKKLAYKSSDYYKYYNYAVGDYFFDFNEEHIYQGKAFGLLPAIKIHHSKGRVNPYARIGAIFSFTSLKYDYDGTYLTNHPYYYPSSNESYTYELKQSLNVGINSAIGVDFYIADKLIVFVEATGSFINYRPKKGEYTKYILNGDDILNDLTVHEREVEYVESYSSTDNLNDNAPRKIIRISYSFSSLGLSAGIRFNFFQ